MDTNLEHDDLHDDCSCSDHFGEGSTVWDLPLPLSVREEWKALATRRHFLGSMGKVLGWAGAAALFGRDLGNGLMAATEMPMRQGYHFAPKAKRAIFLFMGGGPPQMDLWDYKPNLKDWYDKDIPDSVRGNQATTGMSSGQARFPVAPTLCEFHQYGQSGRWVSNQLPWTAQIVDDITVLNTVETDAINHEPAILLMNTGNMIPGKPSLGAWLSYGLGSTNDNLPTFVVLTSKVPKGAGAQPISPRLWGSGFLDSRHAGVMLRSGGDPVLYLKDAPGITAEARRIMLNGVNAMNERTYNELGDPETNSRIAQYEMAFRMQTSVPDLVDFSKEPASTWDLYGPEAKEPGTFAYNCLLARRMAERGVRFTQVYQRGWDLHGSLPSRLPALCQATDRGCFALVTDLKQRGLLEDTLVIWGGEFGRTIFSQGGLSPTNFGRDHHPKAFSMWMAGGGVKSGLSYGKTDDFSFNSVENRVHVRDLNATILRLLGINHDKLAFKFQGLDQKLTGVVPANVVSGILA